LRPDVKKLQILGSGCPKCNELAERTQAAATALGLEHVMEKVSDLKVIMSFGVVRTPALVVDGAVKVAGRVPSGDEIKAMLAG
jgi:small redox-active disulfide protein 2